MCGIFGIGGKFLMTDPDRQFLRDCTIAGAVRGKDSTGFVFMNHAKKTTFIKRPINGTSFIADVYNPALHLDKTTHSVIGHNRAATIGTVSQETCHPFMEGSVIGVHNGTLNKGWQKKLEVSSKCDVDSRGIYRAMAARGIDWVIEHLDGAAALVWTELKTQKTFVWRNDNRQLHYTHSHANKLYWASEKGMLSWVMGRNKIKIGRAHV